MAAIVWNQLNSIQDWTGALHNLLADAKKSLDDDDQGAKLSTQQQLIEFIKQSPQRYDFLDDIASKAAHDLFLDTVDASIQAIASRNAELQQATKIISGVTKEANSDAKTLLLTDVKSNLDKIAVGFTKLQAAAAGDKNLLDRIKGVQDAIAEFKKP